MTSANERTHFDRILEEVLLELSEEVHELLEEAPIIVEDEPSAEILRDFGIEARRGEGDLCGLHSGVPLDERSFFDGSAAPTAIYLFRGPILRLAESEEDLARQIRITLLHEVGHYFGFSEEKLRELGYD